MFMEESDLKVLREASAILDRHGFDTTDIEGAISAAEQANRDEEGSDGVRMGVAQPGWSEPQMVDGALCRQCPACRLWFGVGWYQYHGINSMACKQRQEDAQLDADACGTCDGEEARSSGSVCPDCDA